MHHSEERLQDLIAARLAPGADREDVDRRIWDLFGETWCVMATDLIGFTRGVEEFGIIHFLQTMFEAERLLVPVIEQHDGLVLKVEGDSFLVIFRTAVKGLHASIEMQRVLLAYNAGRTASEQVLLGVGLGFGRVLRIGDSDVFGAEVNTAYVLGEDTANAYEILVTTKMREALEGVEGITFEQVETKKFCAGGAFRVTARR